ncbi:DDE superfamily endonuclease [Hirsutella rhossiliensis]
MNGLNWPKPNLNRENWSLKILNQDPKNSIHLIHPSFKIFKIFTFRHDALMSKYLRKYDYQRALVRATIAKYGIAAEDIYNFDETGFQMGVIATAKVVTQTKPSTSKHPTAIRTKSGRPKVVQPGDRNWVTVIEGVNVTGWALPSTIIFEGKVHQSTWYRTGIPPNWVIGVSENGWTNNELGFKWSTEVFDKHSRGRAVGKYRLLLLDGHGSHFTPEFDDFCKKNSIIWLFYPPHSTHLLQALDFGCFSALKNSYGRLVQEKVELGTFRIDKTDFLVLYHQAHRITFTEKTIKNAFEAVGIVPYNPQKVLSRLNVRTPSPLLQPTTLDPVTRLKCLTTVDGWLIPTTGWSSGSQRLAKTPHNITELEAQAKALQKQVVRGQRMNKPAQPTRQCVTWSRDAKWRCTAQPFFRRKMSDSKRNQRQRRKRICDAHIGGERSSACRREGEWRRGVRGAVWRDQENRRTTALQYVQIARA